MYTLTFDNYNEIGFPMFSVRDTEGFDPIGEQITLGDHFLVENNHVIVSPAPIDYHQIVLEMLDKPVVEDSYRVVADVFEFNDADDLLDVDFFKECASLVISELSL